MRLTQPRDQPPGAGLCQFDHALEIRRAPIIWIRHFIDIAQTGEAQEKIELAGTIGWTSALRAG
jgi:hypothetical protein